MTFADMPYRPISAMVLAAGEGTRMRSSRPKPLHLLCGRPMLLYVVDALAQLPIDRCVIVVGSKCIFSIVGCSSSSTTSRPVTVSSPISTREKTFLL